MGANIKEKGAFVILTLQIIFGVVLGIPVLVGVVAMLCVITVGGIAIIRDVTGLWCAHGIIRKQKQISTDVQFAKMNEILNNI